MQELGLGDFPVPGWRSLHSDSDTEYDHLEVPKETDQGPECDPQGEAISTSYCRYAAN